MNFKNSFIFNEKNVSVFENCDICNVDELLFS